LEYEIKIILENYFKNYLLKISEKEINIYLLEEIEQIE